MEVRMKQLMPHDAETLARRLNTYKDKDGK
jgi:hypothetical protein